MARQRRGWHEGSIYQRDDDRWCASVMANGKRVSYYSTTRKGVVDKLKTATRSIDDGLPLHSDRQKLGQFLDRWLREVAEPGVRPSTYIRYRELLTLHVIPTLGRVPLRTVGPQDISSLYATLSKNLAPRTVGHVHRVLHRALRDALHWGLVARNACDAVRPPAVPRKEMQVLTPEQSRTLLAAASGDPLEALYVLALTTGARQGELLALKWSDFDADAGRLTIQRTVRWVNGQGSVEGEPKSQRSRRSLDLTPMAITALREHRARQMEQRVRAVAWEDNDLIFCNVVGRHIEASNLLWRSFRPLRERAGLPKKLRFHDLRHSAATLLLLQGVNAKVVSEMLGHASVALTLDVYSHVLPAMRSDATAKMEELLAEGNLTAI